MSYPQYCNDSLSFFLSMETPEEATELLTLNDKVLTNLLAPQYDTFEIRKKGNKRIIDRPLGPIAIVQKNISKYLSLVYTEIITENALHPVHSYIPKRADFNLELPFTRRNAKTAVLPHLGSVNLLSIDILKFYETITFDHVLKMFKNAPFNFNEELSMFFSNLVTYKGRLPTGASTSPIISNFILIDFDSYAMHIPETIYTRYADDLLFSTKSKNFSLPELIPTIENRLLQMGFKLNPDKISYKKYGNKKNVLGLVLSEKVNIDRRYIRNIRAVLHNIIMNGKEKSAQIYASKNCQSFISSVRKYYQSRNIKLCGSHPITQYWQHAVNYLELSLEGKIRHIGFIRGHDDPIYLKLYKQWCEVFESKWLTTIDDKKEKVLNKVELEPPLLDKMAFVTNATATSLFNVVQQFFQNKDNNEKEILELKKKVSIYHNEQVSHENIRTFFDSQSDSLIILFEYLKKHENNFSNLYNFRRKIFHTSLECQSLHSDYKEDDGFHKNTGQFANKTETKRINFYMSDIKFLEKLGMRECKFCKGVFINISNLIDD